MHCSLDPASIFPLFHQLLYFVCVGIGFGSALSERKPWDSVESTASPPPPPPREEQPVVAASLSQLPSYLQSPESKTPTSDAAESFSRDVSAPAPSPAPALAPSPAPTPAAVTASAPATALASGLAPAPPAAEDSPPPSPPASPAASMEIEAVTHQSPALGDTGQRLQQLIRDAEGNAMLWADVRQVRCYLQSCVRPHQKGRWRRTKLGKSSSMIYCRSLVTYSLSGRRRSFGPRHWESPPRHHRTPGAAASIH